MTEVVCQLRFSALLRIDAEPPIAFQESVRHEFPTLSETWSAEIIGQLPPFVADAISKATAQRVNYQFGTKDGSWALALTRDFIALTAKRYEAWEEFRRRLLVAVEALQSSYDITEISRTGLRYVNRVCPSELGLGSHQWQELMNPALVAALGARDIGTHVLESKGELLVRLDEGVVRIRHGLVAREDSNDTCYVVDSDLFTETPMEVGDAVNVLDQFHREAGRLFRWSIEPTVHEALGPTET